MHYSGTGTYSVIKKFFPYIRDDFGVTATNITGKINKLDQDTDKS
jgi:hypothetical protein